MMLKDGLTPSYSEDHKRPLLIGMNKKVISFFKDELGGSIKREFVALRPKTYSYLMDDGSEHKRAKRSKKVYNQKKNQV